MAPQLSIRDYYGGSQAKSEIRKAKPGAEIARRALLRMAASELLAASTIYFSNGAQSIVGARFRAFSIRRMCASVAKWCATIGSALVIFDYFVVVCTEGNERCTNALISSAKKTVEKSP